MGDECNKDNQQSAETRTAGTAWLFRNKSEKMRLFYEQWQILEVRPPMAGEIETAGNEDVLEANVIASLNRPPMAGGRDINDFLSISFTHHD